MQVHRPKCLVLFLGLFSFALLAIFVQAWVSHLSGPPSFSYRAPESLDLRDVPRWLSRTRDRSDELRIHTGPVRYDPLDARRVFGHEPSLDEAHTVLHARILSNRNGRGLLRDKGEELCELALKFVMTKGDLSSVPIVCELLDDKALFINMFARAALRKLGARHPDCRQHIEYRSPGARFGWEFHRPK